MIARLVPKAVWTITSTGNPARGKSQRKRGTRITPPPIPSRPAKKPAREPMSRVNIIICGDKRSID
jgi:hypothetical protein